MEEEIVIPTWRLKMHIVYGGKMCYINMTLNFCLLDEKTCTNE
jgi:hypothetical protein